MVVISYNEAAHIGRCLESLLAQDYVTGQLEIVVIDGGSTDGTQEAVRSYASRQSSINLVIEKKRGAAAGRNTGVNRAAYDMVAFLDADCHAPADWLTVLMRAYRQEKARDHRIVAVGGRNIAPVGSSYLQRAIEIMLDSYLGSFDSVQGRQFMGRRSVGSLPTLNSLYEKAVIASMGFFDETLKSEAEDADLNYRLYVADYRFIYLHDSYVYHNMRATPLLWMRNMFRYGKGRARLLKRYPAMRSLVYALPLVFMACMLSFPAGFLFRPLRVFWLYFPFIMIYAVIKCAQKRSLWLFPIVTCMYILHHISYSAGEIYGIINPRVH